MAQQPVFQAPFLGGNVECMDEYTFMGEDRDTGERREVKMPKCVVVTYGRAKARLSGSMVKALAEAYKKHAELRDWCEKCG